MRRIIAFFMVVSLLGTGLAYRVEARGESREGASLKIGYVDIGRVIDGYPRAREAKEALREEQEARHKELSRKREEIDKLEEELKAQEALLKEEEKRKRARLIEEKRRRWEQLFWEYDLEFRSKVMEKQREVLEEIRQAIESFGKEKGYTLILDARQVFYGLKGLDVTEEIIKLLNTTGGSTAP
ncbi:OmpH family outer membrane protein [candidate division NPL-UPA2 bacterium]|nr:OmpH family outer membrane protein [candidate division NPL-UPA2 bacterium]